MKALNAVVDLRAGKLILAVEKNAKTVDLTGSQPSSRGTNTNDSGGILEEHLRNGKGKGSVR